MLAAIIIEHALAGSLLFRQVEPCAEAGDAEPGWDTGNLKQSGNYLAADNI